MIIPLGHEQTTVRRLPWVTFVIMAVCVVAFILTLGSLRGFSAKVEQRADRAVEYYLQHPYLELDPRLERLVFQQVRPDQVEALQSVIQQFSGSDPPSGEEIAEQQRALDEMVDELFSVVKGSPFHTWGLIPSDRTAHGWITYMFMHGGWLHLIGNMFYLYLAAPFIEDRWGRPLFATFYAAAGVFAALAFVVKYPSSDTVLIGASGAIAGVMGAFLVLFWNTRIRFFYWFFTFFYGTFEAPAWLMLPLWFVGQLFLAQASDSLDPDAAGEGVAYLAHAAGFAFGAVVAMAMARFKIEERFIHHSIESKITLVDNPAVEEAMEARVDGRLDEALEILRREVGSSPDNTDAAIALWDLARAQERTGEVAPLFATALASAVRRSEKEVVTTYWPELLHTAPDAVVDCALAVRAAEMLREESRIEDARDSAAAAVRIASAATPPGVLARLGRLAADLHVPVPGGLLTDVASSPDLPPEVRELYAKLEATPDAPPPPASSPEQAPEEAPLEPIEPASVPTHTLRVRDAVPRSLEGALLMVEVAGEVRSLNLETVQALAVGGIAEAGTRPYLVVDLLLDPVWGEQRKLRVVRLESTRFDPRRVVGGDDAMEAFRVLLEQILDASDAVPLPDPDGARGRPFRSYPSLDVYQQKVLGSA